MWCWLCEGCPPGRRARCWTACNARLLCLRGVVIRKKRVLATKSRPQSVPAPSAVAAALTASLRLFLPVVRTREKEWHRTTACRRRPYESALQSAQYENTWGDWRHGVARCVA